MAILSEKVIDRLKNLNTKNSIYEICEKINENISKQYLAHPVRAIEEIYITQIRELYREKKETFKKNITRDKFNKLIPPNFFRIFLKPVEIWNELKAYTHKFEYGFEIFYASDINVNENQKRVLIAHELGHIVLHYKLEDKLKCKSDEIDNAVLETQAFYFAKNLLQIKNGFYKDNKRIQKLIISNKFINDTVISLFPEYDEAILS